ncbi:general transcription factor II-I repeat domain-containing protein 2A-like [Diabrotica virgifera virgifera]|uniref:HAT C-terminal dimerisation domain-containing protein n=1 Tax=Diabrotica virgifera virgifera TaxID=50390 RepID=A0ABM5K4S3_DIAVI|nr:general transcription factor II-I repeat domain-containing protein 2A-like [Diabrotica virgifera virgifera]
MKNINTTALELAQQLHTANALSANTERLFSSTYEYPANSSIRKEKVKQLKNQLVRQQSVLLQVSDKTKATTLASYKVSQVIAKKKKPFEDGEYIKECFVEAANCLSEGFKNKYEIMSAINSLQLSARTVTRRVENMSEDVSQMKTDLQRFIFFSLQFDESIDISDTSQLAIFVRMIFDDFTAKEELVKIIPLKGRTRGEDIFSSVQDYFISENIALQKLVGITTGGAPAFTGVHNGFIALCRKDDTFPNFLTSCISKHFVRRQFRTLIAEMNLEYGELLLHTEIRWLSKGKILRRFYELLPALIAFLKERKEDYSTLEEPAWLRDFGFLTDVTGKLNELNLQLQEVIEKEVVNVQPYTGEGHIEMLTRPRHEFDTRFSDFNKIEAIAQFVSYPYMPLDAESLSQTIEQHFSEIRPETELEIVTLQNDLCLKSVAGKENFWCLVSKQKYPILVNVALKINALFCSTYLCESTFSNMKFIKNKYRSRLTDEHLDSCIRLRITNHQPNVKKLTDMMDCQSSH